jgi:hypothetical protein
LGILGYSCQSDSLTTGDVRALGAGATRNWKRAVPWQAREEAGGGRSIRSGILYWKARMGIRVLDARRHSPGIGVPTLRAHKSAFPRLAHTIERTTKDDRICPLAVPLTASIFPEKLRMIYLVPERS